MNVEHIPACPGAYLLHLRLLWPRRLQVKRLGLFDLSPGEYLYSGSAHGPGGLRARLGRHLRGGGKKHWHIDALRQSAEVAGYSYVLGNELEDANLECRWAQNLAQLPGVIVPISGFGSSDCRLGCRAHLVALPLGSEISKVLTHLAVPYFGFEWD